jgi:hypothetical protein
MRYMRLKVSLPPAADDASSTNAVGARKEQEKKVADLNARFAGWTYMISQYKADSMTVKRDAIVKKKAKPAATNETATASAPAASKTEEPRKDAGSPDKPAAEPEAAK